VGDNKPTVLLNHHSTPTLLDSICVHISHLLYRSPIHSIALSLQRSLLSIGMFHYTLCFLSASFSTSTQLQVIVLQHSICHSVDLHPFSNIFRSWVLGNTNKPFQTTFDIALQCNFQPCLHVPKFPPMMWTPLSLPLFKLSLLPSSTYYANPLGQLLLFSYQINTFLHLDMEARCKANYWTPGSIVSAPILRLVLTCLKINTCNSRNNNWKVWQSYADSPKFYIKLNEQPSHSAIFGRIANWDAFCQALCNHSKPPRYLQNLMCKWFAESSSYKSPSNNILSSSPNSKSNPKSRSLTRY
jgi:hypothetical protein